MRLYKIFSEKKKRVLFKTFELRVLSIKSLTKTRIVSSFFKKDALLKNLYFFNKNSFSTRINNICVFTGRSGGVYRLFRSSRIELRRMAGSKDAGGVRKSSW